MKLSKTADGGSQGGTYESPREAVGARSGGVRWVPLQGRPAEVPLLPGEEGYRV